MIPKRVSLKNFLSFGDVEQALEFTDDEALWVLTGANGVGKSAVFDAITYCLFGEHRAGKQHADNLIRHGANGFRVLFEFELGGADYRITRTLGSNATQRVERKVGEVWNPIPGINNAKELNEWVKGTLGLNFDCFTKSVLLRQGQSDDIIEAGGKERLEILKAIIDVKRFEDLSKRIGDEKKKVSHRLEELQQRRDSSTEVSEEQVADASEALRKAEEARNLAHDAKAIAMKGVEAAERLQALRAEEAKLDELLRAADERAAKRNEIHRDHERFALLRLIVPPLEKIAAGLVKIAEAEARHLRDAAKLATVAKELAAAQAAAEREREKVRMHSEAQTECENRARDLLEDIERESRHLAAAEQVAMQTAALDRFAPDLDAKHAAAAERKRAAGELLAAAVSAKTVAATQLKRAQDDRTNFESVGARCSKCRQPVSEKYAAEEKAAFEASIAEFSRQQESAERNRCTAQDDLARAEAEAAAFAAQIQERNDARLTLAASKKALEHAGIVADARTLNAQLARMRDAQRRSAELAAAEALLQRDAQNEVRRLDTLLAKLTTEHDSLEAGIRDLDSALATERATGAVLIGTLPADWQEPARSISVSEVQALAAERNTLEASGIASRFAALEMDSQSQIVWMSRRDLVRKERAELPSITVADAREALASATSWAAASDRRRDAAKDDLDRLTREAAAFAQLVAELSLVQTHHLRLGKLDGWLGRQGLLRDLVRDAECEIVRFARETLQKLSGGALDIELEPSEDNTEALKLLVRLSGNPHPVSVKFLSGSQKFRVAVAIAVAIGKFAAGPASARPLESVIIDEGFGSLDKDGLQAMREELDALKNSQALKRVILVSHQEEFTNSFPNGYRLTAAENGTIATRFRH